MDRFRVLSGECSGHTAFSYASMGVVTLYLLGKLRVLQRERLQMLSLLVSLAPVALATCIAVSTNLERTLTYSTRKL
jgi:membrane-associated phospholipid phosphatase